MTVSSEWNHGGITLSDDGGAIIVWARNTTTEADAMNLRIPREAFQVTDEAAQYLALPVTATAVLETTETTLDPEQDRRRLALAEARAILVTPGNTFTRGGLPEGRSITDLTDLAQFILDGSDPLAPYQVAQDEALKAEDA